MIHSRRARRRRARRRRAFSITALVAASVTALISLSGAASSTTPADQFIGAAGTDTNLPPTASAVTVHGSGPFSQLAVTVNQTANLVNQAISISWSGGAPTDSALGTFGGQFFDNYLQIMQCWSPPGAASPDPSQCEFGGRQEPNPSWAPGFSDRTPWMANSREVDNAFPAGATPAGYYQSPGGQYLWEPFSAVDGTLVQVSANPNAIPSSAGNPGNGVKYWLNDWFNYNNTNEIPNGLTRPDGTGAALFTVDTAFEAPGLGCGGETYPSNGGSVVPQCWLVIVPRGAPSLENAPGDNGIGVNTSPLLPGPWSRRIQIPLGFNPISSACSLGRTATRLIGSELAAGAFASWQPKLCEVPNLPPYTFASLSDGDARQQLVSGTTSMAVVTRPLASSDTSNLGSTVYAPISLSGAVIGFNIQRSVDAAQPAGEQILDGVHVTHINLTPRLVAKVLTESYRGTFPGLTAYNAVYGANYPPFGYDWLKPNPISLFSDPDFLQYNPEFTLLNATASHGGVNLVVEEPRSDTAYEVWRWILSDPAAQAWLAGKADPWGMNVNPYYSSDPNVNTTGSTFGSPIPESYPKSDPFCYQDPVNIISGTNQLAAPLCIQDHYPYAISMLSAAAETRSTNIGARTSNFDGHVYGADGPEGDGVNDVMMSITDSPSAAQYGLQTASLSAGGDDGSNPNFVTPDSGSFTAAVPTMQPSGVAGVLQPNVAKSGTYPLALLAYAAAIPAAIPSDQRPYYGALLRYAAGPGQEPGQQFGQLPPGYAPLPDSFRAQALQAAAQIEANPQSPGTTTAPTGSTNGANSNHSGTSPSVGTVGAGFGSSSSGTGGTSNSGAATGGSGSQSASKAVTPFQSRSSRSTSGVLAPAARYLFLSSLAVGVLCAFVARWVQVWRRRRAYPASPTPWTI